MGAGSCSDTSSTFAIRNPQYSIEPTDPKRRYPSELRKRAVRMYFEAVDRASERHGVVTRIAQLLGIGAESLRNWVRQAEVDRGERRGTTTEDAQRMAELER